MPELPCCGAMSFSPSSAPSSLPNSELVWAGTLPFGLVRFASYLAKLECSGFRHRDNVKIALFVVIVMMGFCPSREESSGFPKQHVPDLHPTVFLWAHLVVCANWVYLHSLGLQSKVKIQGLTRSLTSWIQSKVNPALKGPHH